MKPPRFSKGAEVSAPDPPPPPPPPNPRKVAAAALGRRQVAFHALAQRLRADGQATLDAIGDTAAPDLTAAIDAMDRAQRLFEAARFYEARAT